VRVDLKASSETKPAVWKRECAAQSWQFSAERCIQHIGKSQNNVTG
jgi:hypothetical protein